MEDEVAAEEVAAWWRWFEWYWEVLVFCFSFVVSGSLPSEGQVCERLNGGAAYIWDAAAAARAEVSYVSVSSRATHELGLALTP